MSEQNGGGQPDYAALARDVAKLAAQRDRDRERLEGTERSLAEAQAALVGAVKR